MAALQQDDALIPLIEQIADDAACALRVIDHHGVHIGIAVLGQAVCQHHGQIVLVQALIQVAVIAADHKKPVDLLIQKILHHLFLSFWVVFAVDDHDLPPILRAGVADAAQQLGRLAGHDVGHDDADQIAAGGLQTVGQSVGTIACVGDSVGDAFLCFGRHKLIFPVQIAGDGGFGNPYILGYIIDGDLFTRHKMRSLLFLSLCDGSVLPRGCLLMAQMLCACCAWFTKIIVKERQLVNN